MASLLLTTLLSSTAMAMIRLNGAERQLHKALASGSIVVDHDSSPIELDFSNHTHENLEEMGRERRLRFTGFGKRGLEHNPNHVNGTPWYRYKHVSKKGTADHEHFDGLVAKGDFNSDILLAHNTVREFAGLRPLRWNTELAQLAADRVHKLAHHGCYIRHSPTSARWRKNGFYYIGENLYKVINMVPTGVDIVDAWYAEIADYTYGRVGNTCTKGLCEGRTNPPCMLGHFTQVMWADSTQLGCAKLECPDQEKRTFVSVCNYGEGGNLVGTFPFRPEHAETLGLNVAPCPLPNTSHYLGQGTRAEERAASRAGRESDDSDDAKDDVDAKEKSFAVHSAGVATATVMAMLLLSGEQ